MFKYTKQNKIILKCNYLKKENQKYLTHEFKILKNKSYFECQI